MIFTQPDSSSCVPTSFAYLVHKEFGLDFDEIFKEVFSASKAMFDLENNGMSFSQLCDIVEPLGFRTSVHSEKPQSAQYLAGVERLSKVPYIENSIMTQSIKDGSLEITDTEFVYPEGHAIAVFEGGKLAKVFDSFLGLERDVPLVEILENLEKGPEFLVAESYVPRKESL